jgi:hypothetical protein
VHAFPFSSRCLNPQCGLAALRVQSLLHCSLDNIGVFVVEASVSAFSLSPALLRFELLQALCFILVCLHPRQDDLDFAIRTGDIPRVIEPRLSLLVVRNNNIAPTHGAHVIHDTGMATEMTAGTDMMIGVAKT